MLRKSDLGLAVEVLKTYEEAYYPDQSSVSDIEQYLFWDGTRNCFSVDAGFLLRGDCENVRIFQGLSDWIESGYPVNQFDAAVIYEGEIFFIWIVGDYLD